MSYKTVIKQNIVRDYLVRVIKIYGIKNIIVEHNGATNYGVKKIINGGGCDVNIFVYSRKDMKVGKKCRVITRDLVEHWLVVGCYRDVIGNDVIKTKAKNMVKERIYNDMVKKKVLINMIDSRVCVYLEVLRSVWFVTVMMVRKIVKKFKYGFIQKIGMISSNGNPMVRVIVKRGDIIKVNRLVIKIPGVLGTNVITKSKGDTKFLKVCDKSVMVTG